MKLFKFKQITLLTCVTLMAGCAVGPDYERPQMDVGDQYAAVKSGDWTQAKPADAAEKGDWWTAYQLPELNRLMDQLNQQNFTIAQAYANYQAALAQVRESRSDLFPSIDGQANSSRGGGTQTDISKSTSAGLSLSWEIDLWGSVRREIEGAQAEAQSTQADLANTRLSLQATLADDYFALRMTDLQQKLLNDIVAAYEKSVQINQNRYEQGVAARADVISAQVQLDNAKLDAIQLEATRHDYETAIAVLLGVSPSQFHIEPVKEFNVVLPTVPVGLPSELLQRRPDIASAERLVMQANANIGVAKAAWFPSLSLSASTSWSKSGFLQWIGSPLNVWSLGPALAMNLLDGGAKAAQVASANAKYQAQVANYKEVVLDALKEVEDALNSSTNLAQQTQMQERVLEGARRSLTITTNQYMAGLVGYLDVVQVQDTAYNAEISRLQLQLQRLQASVQLIKALGGGWHAPEE